MEMEQNELEHETRLEGEDLQVSTETEVLPPEVLQSPEVSLQPVNIDEEELEPLEDFEEIVDSGDIHISREWLFTKILDASQKKYHGKLCGLVLAGNSGAGKTTFCRNLSADKKGVSRKQTLIRNKLIASYLVPSGRLSPSSHLVQFMHSVYCQLCSSTSVSRFKQQTHSGWLREAVDDPDEVFKRVILFPLLECEVQHKVVIILVDGLNLELISHGVTNPDVPSKSIPELLSRHAHLFPRWLLPVFTTRQSSLITTHFPGFRRISIDDLRKTQVIQDIQQFILERLQKDRSISRKVTKDSTELLSLLHVKSAGCFLFIKKVLDGVSEGYIELEEIREIPGTLNGLYLWLCQKQFNKKTFNKVRPLVNILISNSNLTEGELQEILTLHNHVKSGEEFQKLLLQLRPLLSPEYRSKHNRQNDFSDGCVTVSLYHYSLAEWFVATKFCGPAFECDPDEGRKAVKEWRTHIQADIYDKPDLVSGLDDDENSEMWMLLDTEDRKKRKEKEAKPKVMEESLPRKSIMDCVRDNDIHNLKKLLRLKTDSDSNIGTPGSSRSRLSESVAGDWPEQLASGALLSAREGQSDSLRLLLMSGQVHPDTCDENGWTLLRTAAWSGQELAVKVLLECGADVNKVASDLRSALRAACWAGHLACVKLLLEATASVNQVDSEGRTAMIAACYMGHIDCVRELIIWGANIEIMDQDGRTALSVAVTCESENAAKLVTLLIDNGANPNQADKEGMSPLLMAAFEGKYQVCEILLENGADVDHADREGKTAIFAAASMGHLDILNLLLFWGCYVDGIDCEGRTVLSVAAVEGSVSIVKVLLDRGLDEQHRDNAGWGPLHYAAFEGHIGVVNLLLEAGAELDMVDCDGKSALHLAVAENHYDVIVQLLRVGAEVNVVNLQGRSPLRIAVLEGNLDIAGLLLDNGANIDYLDNDSRSTLYIMALENDLKAVEFLLNHGANTELRDGDGRTALHVAAWQGYTDIVQVLLLNGADVNSLDGGERSALLSACWQGHLDIVDILLTAGADVDRQCCQGASPLAVSAQEGHIAVLKLLLQHGADPLQQDHQGRDPYRVALRNNNAIAAELLEKYMKRLSDCARVSAEMLSRTPGQNGDEDPDSPLYASPTAYGYAKIGAYSKRSSSGAQEIQDCTNTLNQLHLAQESDFTFSQNSHMAIILGRQQGGPGHEGSGSANSSSGGGGGGKAAALFENIKEKAKNGFGVTKRNFL